MLNILSFCCRSSPRGLPPSWSQPFYLEWSWLLSLWLFGFSSESKFIWLSLKSVAYFGCSGGITCVYLCMYVCIYRVISIWAFFDPQRQSHSVQPLVFLKILFINSFPYICKSGIYWSFTFLLFASSTLYFLESIVIHPMNMSKPCQLLRLNIVYY